MNTFDLDPHFEPKPLEPDGDGPGEAPDYVAAAFEPGGYFSQIHPGYEPRVGQIEMAYEVQATMEEGGNTLIEAPTGCHAKGQGILMFDGSVKKVEDIVVGDLLMGPDCNYRRVLLLARGRQEMVDVVPEHGKTWRVNLDHILTLASEFFHYRLFDICLREFIESVLECDFEQYRLVRVNIKEGPHTHIPLPVSETRLKFSLKRTGVEEDYYGFSLSGDGRFLLDDGTITHNTGKSLAYGVPATHLASKGERVVIVTANIALQEQLIDKDLPTLAKALPWQFTYALAKGMNNYVCRANFEETANDVVLEGIEGTVEEQAQWAEVVRWYGETANGDLSELSFEPSAKLRPKFTTTSEDCPGKKCPHYANCFAQRARARAKSSQLVVTNYALFFADMMIKAGGAPGLLPNYKHVVLDEAHKTTAAARDFMGFRTSLNGILWATKLLDAPAGHEAKKGMLPVLNEELKKSVNHAAERMFAELMKTFNDKRYNIRFKQHWRGPLQEYAHDLCALLRKASSVFAIASVDKTLTEIRRHELMMMGLRCATHATNIGNAAEQNIDGWVFFLEEDGKERVALRGSPVSVGEFLRNHLFEKKDTPAEVEFDEDEDSPYGYEPEAKEPHVIKSVVATSATLATTLGDFEYIENELGVRDAVSLTVESPFDIAKNTLVITPPMPSPNNQRFTEAVGKQVVEVVERSRGRALSLHTSHRLLEETYKRVSGARLPYRVYRQGQAPRTKLIAQFRQDVSSILLGTESFWAGVDVPGESCSVVIVDRIPFPNISDPIQDFLKSKMDRDYFFKVSIPAAVIALRQGVGRLLRTTTDRGVIVLLDSRVSEKGYGKKFLRIFPEGTVITRDIDAIQEFLE